MFMSSIWLRDRNIRTISITDGLAKERVNCTKGLSFPSMMASSKATTLLGTSIDWEEVGGGAGGAEGTGVVA